MSCRDRVLRSPYRINTVVQLDEATGVDLQADVVLKFSPASNLAPALQEANTNESTPKLPGAGIATCTIRLLCESAEETTVIGTKGPLTTQSPGHCSTNLPVSD